MTDAAQGQQPVLDAVDAIEKHSLSNEQAAMELAEGLVWQDDLDEPVGDPAEPDLEAKPEPTEPEAKPQSTEERKTFDELAKLAAEKRAERQAQEAQRDRERRERDLDEERRDFERKQREFAARERALEEDPFDYLQRHKGWDQSTAAEKLVAKQLRPKEVELEERIAAQDRELKALRERYESDTQTRAQQEQQREHQAYLASVYESWDNVTSNAESFPELAACDAEERRWRGDRMSDRLREAYPGRNFSHEEIAQWVEHDLQAKLKRRTGAPDASSGGNDEAPAGNGAGTKRPPATLTNDLASQSAGTGVESRDWDSRKKNALRELGKHGW